MTMENNGRMGKGLFSVINLQRIIIKSAAPLDLMEAQV